MSDDNRARVNLTHEADRPSEDADALYYDLLELVDASEDSADELAWIKGAAIAKIEARYGESRRQLFATEARIARSTAYEYAQMWSYFAPVLLSDAKFRQAAFETATEGWQLNEMATEFCRGLKRAYPSLRRTHFRLGMRVGRKLGVDAALAYLDDCQGRALSIEAAGIEAAKLAGKPVPPKPVAEFESVIEMFEDRSTALRWTFTPPFSAHLEWGTRYRVVVYAVDGAV